MVPDSLRNKKKVIAVASLQERHWLLDHFTKNVLLNTPTLTAINVKWEKKNEKSTQENNRRKEQKLDLKK